MRSRSSAEPAEARVQGRAGFSRVDLPVDALDDFVSRAAARNEMGLAIARVVIATLAVVRHLFLHTEKTLALAPKYVFIFICLLAALAFYSWICFTLRPSPRLHRRLRVSVLFDVCFLFAVLLPAVVLPAATYHGLVHLTEIYFLPLIVVCSGLRLSPSIARLGSIAGVGASLLLVTVDYALNREIITSHWGEIATLLMLLSGASLVAVATATRTLRLVHEGAFAAVAADRSRNRLGMYLSESIAREALEAPELRVGGRHQEVAVLFCDLRGFTSYSESKTASALVSELNAYLDAMVRAVKKENGVVDKFIGDALMVVFGVPRSRGDAAIRAIRCAAAMREALARHNDLRAGDGLAPLENGIGVHFGEAIVGNIGNAERLQYTVVGDVVNVASRLESATKEQGAHALISADTVEAAGGLMAPGMPYLRSAGPIAVRGRGKSVEAFSLEPPYGLEEAPTAKSAAS